MDPIAWIFLAALLVVSLVCVSLLVRARSRRIYLEQMLGGAMGEYVPFLPPMPTRPRFRRRGPIGRARVRTLEPMPSLSELELGHANCDPGCEVRPNRTVLPMSSIEWDPYTNTHPVTPRPLKIKPGTPMQITKRPQGAAFKPERIVITSPDFVVHDIKVGNRSQFPVSGDVPGEVFAASAIDNGISFDTVQTAMDLTIIVSYIGKDPDGAPFLCDVFGLEPSLASVPGLFGN